MHARPFVIASFVFWLLTLQVVFLELRPFFEKGGTRETRFSTIATGGNQPGLSVTSQHLSLDQCLEAVNSIFGRLQLVEQREQVLNNCAGIATNITQASPVNSYGWFIRALVGAERGDFAGMNRQLEKSYQTAPNEIWIAELRAEFAEQHLANLDAASGAGHENDLKLLAQSPRGVSAIARRYVTQPEFRARIAVLVEDLPEDVQARFVDQVHRWAVDAEN